jgi:hypothetical protein
MKKAPSVSGGACWKAIVATLLVHRAPHRPAETVYGFVGHGLLGHGGDGALHDAPIAHPASPVNGMRLISCALAALALRSR